MRKILCLLGLLLSLPVWSDLRVVSVVVTEDLASKEVSFIRVVTNQNNNGVSFHYCHDFYNAMIPDENKCYRLGEKKFYNGNEIYGIYRSLTHRFNLVSAASVLLSIIGFTIVAKAPQSSKNCINTAYNSLMAIVTGVMVGGLLSTEDPIHNYRVRESLGQIIFSDFHRKNVLLKVDDLDIFKNELLFVLRDIDRV